MAGLYIHVPFCVSKCPYCSFASYSGLEAIYERYTDAVRKELKRQAESATGLDIDTVFIGGGTPTVLPVESLISVLERCRECYSLNGEVEISIEANPGTVTEGELLKIRQAGANRISIGVQSFSDSELQLLGRRYCSETAKAVFREARSAGFANISMDLMYGLPGQDHRGWEKNLEEAVRLKPDHLSCYQLAVEAGTPFAKNLADGDLSEADETEIEKMDALTVDWLQSAGLQQYEISNYAKPGFECRHNCNYWLNGSYYAAGAAAVSCLNGRRQKREEMPLRYCQMIEEGRDPVIEEEFLDREASFRESVVMGLRLVQGVSRQLLVERYGLELQTYYGSRLSVLLDQGLLELNDASLRLTALGRRIANRVMIELV